MLKLVSSQIQYLDFEQPASDYVVKTAQEAIKDEDDGVPNLRGEKGFVGDIAKLYKRMFRLGKSPAKPAVIVVSGGERHPLSLAQLGELLNSIMEKARKEVIDELMGDDKKAKAASVPRADTSFVLDQECLLAVGIARYEVAVYHPLVLCTLTAFSPSLSLY